MNWLTTQDIVRVNALTTKIRAGTASAGEMKEFLALIKKSGDPNWNELQLYLHSSGYSSADAFQKRMNEKEAQEFWDGLAKIGLAILIAYALSELFKK